MKEPLFVLSPPRSFSSLVSTMIGQHPELHAFPELQVFNEETLGDMMAKNNKRYNRLASPGSIRSIAEVHEQKQTDESCTRAWLWLQKHAEWSPSEFFNYLREQVAPQIAIEKTPFNSCKASALETIVQTYPNAKYLHLTRSINGNAKSLKEFLKDQDQALGRKKSKKLTSRDLTREYPASIWYTCHRNILNIKPLINASNFLQIKGEDLLNHPEKVLSNFCKWMNIDITATSINSMIRPHESPYACIGPKIAGGGNDGKFMRQPVLKLKNTEKSKILRTYTEPAEDQYYKLGFKKFFKEYKELSEYEIKRIECWHAQLSEEIYAMQERLGY